MALREYVTRHRGWLSLWELAILLFGLVISIVTAIVLQDIRAALLGAVLTMQVEIMVRTTNLLSAWTRWEPILAEMRDGPPSWFANTESLIKSLSRLEHSTTDERAFLRAAERRVGETAGFVQSCADGSMTAERSQIEIMFHFAALARESILAVTSYRDLPWWRGNYGRDFLRIQADALVKHTKLRIERIMIILGDLPDAAETEVMQLLSAHDRMTVSWVSHAMAEKHGCDINVTVVDRRFAHADDQIGPDAPERHRYSVKGTEIDAVVGDYKKLGVYATPFDR